MKLIWRELGINDALNKFSSHGSALVEGEAHGSKGVLPFEREI